MPFTPRRIPKLAVRIHTTAAMIEFMRSFPHPRDSAEGEQFYFAGIPVIEDPKLTDTQWKAYDEDGNEILEGGEDGRATQAAA